MGTFTVQVKTLAAGIELPIGTEAHDIVLAASDAPTGELWVSVRDHEGHDGLPAQDYTITGPHDVNLKGQTDKKGELRHKGPFPMDVYTLKVCGMEFAIDARGPKDGASVIRVPGFGHEMPPVEQHGVFKPRASDAMTGREFLEQTKKLPVRGAKSRESVIYEQIVAGNMPSFCRTWATIHLEWKDHKAVVQVLPDYVSIGSDADYVRVPMGAHLAQRVADLMGASLPTQVVVDECYVQAQVRLQGHPLPPTEKMTTNEWIRKSDDYISGREPCTTHGDHCALNGIASATRLVAGHKKDVIISHEIKAKPDRLSFWGFYLTYNSGAESIKLGDTNTPVQKWSGGVHEIDYCDYSHAVRLVHPTVQVDGVDKNIKDILQDRELAPLFTHNYGVIPVRYD